MIIHLSTSIDWLLRLKDWELMRMLDAVTDENGDHPNSVFEFRKELEKEKALGHRLLPVPECDNFDPVIGCLGHPSKKDDEKKKT